MRRVGAVARMEFLRAAAEHFGGVEVAVAVHRKFVDRPEQARRRAVRAPCVQEMSVQVVLHHLVERTRERPQELIVADADVVRLRDAWKLIQVLSVLIEHLDAVVRAV